MTRLAVIMLGLVAVALDAAEVTVDLGGEHFSPARMVLRVGDSLSFIRATDQSAAVTLEISSDTGVQGEVPVLQGGLWRYEFTEPGRYQVVIREQPSVRASILVFSAAAQNADLGQEMVSYSLGYDMGRKLAADVDNLGLDLFTAGIEHAYRHSDPKINRSEIEYIVAEFGREVKRKANLRQDRAAGRNLELGQQFFEQNGQEDGVVELPTGLQYKIIRPGVGSSPTIGSGVTVNYQMSLLNGTVLDSTENGPAEFILTDDVLPGFAAGLRLMSTGAIWKLYVPPHLAYGVRGQTGFGADGAQIEPNVALIFDVELLAVDEERKSHKADSTK